VSTVPELPDLTVQEFGGQGKEVLLRFEPQTATAMAVLAESMDATRAVQIGLAHRVVDGDHEQLVAAAVQLAAPAATAPRELVLATKSTLRTTASIDVHADAVETELTAQLESMASPAFAELLAALRARISKQA